MVKTYRIGLFAERARAYGRRLCEGVAAFAMETESWALESVEDMDLRRPSALARYDGFIARILDDRIAAAFAATGKPVVDVFFNACRPGFAVVDQNPVAIAQLAARHFITRRFKNFAFCGYDGILFSDARRTAFVHCLELNHFGCAVYQTPRAALRDFGTMVVRRERLGAAPDERPLADWVRALPKPVAVLCSHDLRAYHLLRICRNVGIVVPRQVAILGVDDDPLVCGFTHPPLSSIDPDAFAVGHAAAEVLQRMLVDETVRAHPPVLRVKPKGLTVRSSSEIYPLDPPWLSDALVFIRCNVTQRVTASDVFAHLGRSHTLVDAAFRSVIGRTVQQEIARSRLEEARRLVGSSSLPLAEIAARCGFASSQYFSRSYAAAFGAPPSRHARR